MTSTTFMNDLAHFWAIWKLMVFRASVLAARHPELGINPDNLHLEPPEQLAGILKRLENHHDKGSSAGED